jgi:hypothetical protein
LPNLASDDFVVAGIVKDRIQGVEVASLTPVTPVNNALASVQHQIADIVIRETELTALQRGTEIWVYAVGARSLDLEFRANPRAIINEDVSSLRLATGRPLEFNFGNSRIHGMRYVVTEVSGSSSLFRNRGEAGVITLTDAVVSGPIFSGNVDYQIVVSGNAVAANNYAVFEFDNTVTAARDNSHVLFHSLPYTDDIFEIEEFVPEEQAPIVVPPPPVIVHPPVSTLTLNEFSPEVNGFRPFILVGSTGWVAARFFGEYFFGDDAVGFEDGIATVTGVNFLTGVDTVVTFSEGSSRMTVNGVESDIATFGGHPGRVEGSVTVALRDGRLYLPARSLGDAFGITVGWNSDTNTVSFTRN